MFTSGVRLFPKSNEYLTAKNDDDSLEVEYNIILLDVEEDKIVKNAAFCLNETKYLSETNQLPSWPANGIIFQANHSRNFIHLICQYDDNPGINVIFCVEPGSTKTYLTDRTISAIYKDNKSDSLPNIKIHGLDCEVFKSNFKNSQFKQVNLLGCDYLKKYGLKLILHYQKTEVELRD